MSLDDQLIKAADTGDLEAARRLLDHGANPDARNYNVLSTRARWRPLQLATGLGHLEIVRLLLDRGAAIDAIVEYPAGMDRIVEPGTQTALLIAIRIEREDIAALLLERGADVRIADGYDRNTPIVEASRLGLTSTVERLLARGADPDDGDAISQASATELATRGGHHDIVGLLREAIAARR